MDRNQVGSINRTINIIVALRKESVDRNRMPVPARIYSKVALRKESVDRNITRGQLPTPEPVALRKESVDRNSRAANCQHRSHRRSPQGERG